MISRHKHPAAKIASAFSILHSRRSILAGALAGTGISVWATGVGHHAQPVSAQKVTDLSLPDAFPTSASGLMAATKDDRNVAIARLDLPTGQVVPDPVSGLPGFIIAIRGTVIVSTDDQAVAVLQVGDAIWLTDGVSYMTRPLDRDAAIWRVAISPDVRGQDISEVDSYTLSLGDLTDNAIPDGAQRAYSVRAGLIPDGSSLSLGSDDETVIYAFSLSGTFTLTDNNKNVEDEAVVSPFFGMQPGVVVTGSDAYVGYVVQGPILDWAPEHANGSDVAAASGAIPGFAGVPPKSNAAAIS
jgi:hypothetical protein